MALLYVLIPKSHSVRSHRNMLLVAIIAQLGRTCAAANKIVTYLKTVMRFDSIIVIV